MSKIPTDSETLAPFTAKFAVADHETLDIHASTWSLLAERPSLVDGSVIGTFTSITAEKAHGYLYILDDYRFWQPDIKLWILNLDFRHYLGLGFAYLLCFSDHLHVIYAKFILVSLFFFMYLTGLHFDNCKFFPLKIVVAQTVFCFF